MNQHSTNYPKLFNCSTLYSNNDSSIRTSDPANCNTFPPWNPMCLLYSPAAPIGTDQHRPPPAPVKNYFRTYVQPITRNYYTQLLAPRFPVIDINFSKMFITRSTPTSRNWFLNFSDYNNYRNKYANDNSARIAKTLLVAVVNKSVSTCSADSLTITFIFFQSPFNFYSFWLSLSLSIFIMYYYRHK